MTPDLETPAMPSNPITPPQASLLDRPGPTHPDPRALLTMFSLLNVLIYLDRGAISSNGINADGVVRDFDVSVVRDGLLPSAFMIGLLVSSPIYASLASSPDRNEMRLIGYGLVCWAAAVLGCAASMGFWSLLICRMAVGVGEASFVALASPFIDDVAPPDRKALWLAVFYACIPVGYALGFLYGGTVAVAVGWRLAFAIEAAMMIPFLAYAFLSSRGRSHVVHEEGEDHEAQEEGSRDTGAGNLTAPLVVFLKDTIRGRHMTYLLVTLALTCYTGVIGSYAYFGPQAAKSMFGVSSETTDIAFSVMTVTTGIFGTFAGGHVLDLVGNSIRNGMLLGAVAMAGAAIVILVAFLAVSSFTLFCVVFSIGEFLLFFIQAPSNALILWSVPRDKRAIAVSLGVVCQHVLGDVPGPPFMGLIQEHITQNWHTTMSLAVIVITLGAAFYALGVRQREAWAGDGNAERGALSVGWNQERDRLVDATNASSSYEE